jgi:hypothetical protein
MPINPQRAEMNERELKEHQEQLKTIIFVVAVIVCGLGTLFTVAIGLFH